MKKFWIILITIVFLGPVTATAQTSSVDILWEAETTAPPTYLGRRLPTTGSVVRLTALPTIVDARGQNISARDLVFKWEKDSYQIHSHSGRGRDILPIYVAARGNLVKVTIYDLNGRLLAENSLRLKPEEPRLLFYAETSPNLADYRRALGPTLNLQRDELTLVGEPLFLDSAEFANGQFNFTWRYGGELVTGATGRRLILEQMETSPGGTGKIELEINNGETGSKRLNFKNSLELSYGQTGFGF